MVGCCTTQDIGHGMRRPLAIRSVRMGTLSSRAVLDLNDVDGNLMHSTKTFESRERAERNFLKPEGLMRTRVNKTKDFYWLDYDAYIDKL